MASSSKLTGDLNVFEPKIYKVPPGTMNHGREYRMKTAALLSLRCMEQTKDMWLTTDADGCDYFDDIVLYRQHRNGTRVAYLIQVHYRSRPDTITKEQYTSPVGPFSVKRISYEMDTLNSTIYSKQSKSEIIDCLRHVDKILIIIFTNRNTSDTGYLQEVEENPDLNIVNTNGKVHQFQLPDFSKELSKQIYLFTNQPDINNINQEITIAIENLLSSKFSVPDEVVQKYVTFIAEWSAGSLGGHYPLNKTRILKVLTEFLFEPYMEKSFYRDKFANNCEMYKIYKWHFITENKDVTIINMDTDNNDDTVYKLLWRYFHDKIDHHAKDKMYISNWEQRFTEEDQTLFYKNSPELVKNEMLKTVGNTGKISVYSLYKVLSRLKEIPVVLAIHTEDNYDDMLHVLKLSDYAFKVVILNMSKMKHLSIREIPKPFSRIYNLDHSRSEMILQGHVKLQGRSVQLKWLTKICKFLTNMDVKNIIDVLMDTFNVGNLLNKLPDYYIKRNISKTLVDIKQLFEVISHCADMCVIYCKNMETLNSCFENHNIELPESFIIDYQNIRDQKNIPTGCRIIAVSGESSDLEKVDIQDKNVHYLELNCENNLELLRTSGSAENISSCTLQTKSDELQTEDYAIPKPGEIKIIAGSPGIGKTTTLDYLAQNAPQDFWILQIKLRQHINYYDSAEFQDEDPFKMLKHINKQILLGQKCPTSTDLEAFESFLNSKSVLLILDGFDEISPMHKTKVTQMIRRFKTENFRIWLATRSVLKTHVEREFDAVAITLPKFTNEEQLDFLMAYFSTKMNVPQGENIKRFSIRLLDLIQETLNYYKEPLTGVPLHIELLAKLFEPSFINYINQPENEIPNISVEENLLNLCKTLVSEKTNILTQKFGDYARATQIAYEEDQQLVARQLLFQEINLNRQIDSLISEKKSEMLQKDGIIMTDGNPANVSFVDQLLAEYLVATWLIEQPQDSSIARTIQNNNYGVVNQLLEQIRIHHLI